MKRKAPLNGKVRKFAFPSQDAVFTRNDKPAPKFVPKVSFESRV